MVGRLTLAVLCFALATQTVQAQDAYNLTAPVPNLATIFTDLFGPRGLIVDSLATLPGEQATRAHFVSDFQFNFGQFSTALVSQLVSVPLPSPGGGFTYEFDPSLGVFRRTTQSFGPILTDRAETIGAGRVSMGFALPAVHFRLDRGSTSSRSPRSSRTTTRNCSAGERTWSRPRRDQGDVNQSTVFLTLGVTDRFDLSVAVPIVKTDLQVVSSASIQRLGTTNELTHFYRQSDGSVGTIACSPRSAAPAGWATSW